MGNTVLARLCAHVADRRCASTCCLLSVLFQVKKRGEKVKEKGSAGEDGRSG